jgi:hypothetical protein
MNKTTNNGQIIIIGADVVSKEGVMFHISGITFAEAKKYDPNLTESEYNKLIGLEPVVVKKDVYKPKVEKAYKYK